MIKFTQARQLLSAALLLLLGFCTPFNASADSTTQPTIAIIIDDMGNQYQTGLELVRLPFPLTLSFLPDRPHSTELSILAELHHKEIMLHSPMENSLGLKLGKGGLRTNMSEQEIKRTLANSFAAIPGMIGINNHMGSKLTSNPIVMEWVMEKIKQHPFYFVDSRTTAESVAAKTAERLNIPNLSRDVFLDHKQTRKFVQKQFLKLIEIAREKGSAIAIAHPHRVTVDYLSWALPKLDEKGIRLATVSALWRIQHPYQVMHQPSTQKQSRPHTLKSIAHMSSITHNASQNTSIQ